MSMEQAQRTPARRNGLVMLPQTEQCPSPPPECGAGQAAANDTLLPGARELLRITGEAWAPLHASDAVPMPLPVRQRLQKLRAEYQRKTGRGYIDAENQEWFGLPKELRMAMLVVAGIEGNLPELVGRDMRETPPLERQAIKAVARSMKRHTGRLVALASLW